MLRKFDGLNARMFRVRRNLWELTQKKVRSGAAPGSSSYLDDYFVRFHSSRADQIVWTNGRDPLEIFFDDVSQRELPRVLEIGSRRIVAPIDQSRLGPKATYVGLDIQEGPNVDVVGDAHKLDALFPPKTFDAIVSISVFEHIAMPWQVARAMNRVLKPGGIVCILTHHAYPNHELPWDFWRYGADAFGTIFNEKSGFEIVDGGLGNSARVVRRDRLWTTDPKAKHYLFTGVVARKVGSVQPVPSPWMLDYNRALPDHHHYPRGTYQIADEACKYQGVVEHSAPRFVSHAQWMRAVLDALPKAGRGLLICGPLTNVRGLRSSLPSAMSWQVVQCSGEIGDCESLPTEKFDAVLSFDPLSHFPYPWEIAAKITSLIRPDGILAVREAATPSYRPGIRDYWSFTSESLQLVYHPDLGVRQLMSTFVDPWVAVPHNPIQHPLVPENNCFTWAAAIYSFRQKV